MIKATDIEELILLGRLKGWLVTQKMSDPDEDDEGPLYYLSMNNESTKFRLSILYSIKGEEAILEDSFLNVPDPLFGTELITGLAFEDLYQMFVNA